MELLLGLSCLLVFVTVVGHGIWVLLAKLFSTASSNASPSAGSLKQTHCPRCWAPTSDLPSASPRRCSVCNWPEPVSVGNKNRVALQALEKQLSKFTDLGVVDSQIHHRLAAAIATEKEGIEPSGQEQGQQESASPAASEFIPAEVVATPPSQTPEPAVQAASIEEKGKTHDGTPSSDTAERVRDFSARRAKEPVVQKQDDVPPQSRLTIPQILTAFMEEKNIRWGELVGGLCIVCCSIGLVIALWAQIAQRPFVKFFIFNGVTVALFGIGFYTAWRWKLRTTSRGVLIISTLLVPLNILAIAAFTESSPPTDIFSIGGEILSLIVFAVLIFMAAKIVTSGASGLMMTGVMVPSIAQLLTRRYVDPTSPLWELYLMASIPIVSFLTVNAADIRQAWSERTLNEPRSNALFILLGVVAFATLLPLGLLLYKSQQTYQTLHELSPLIALLGLPALVTGLLFWNRVTEQELAGIRTAGISIGVFGAVIILLSVVLAWPDPAFLVPVALGASAAFFWVAIYFGIPPAHFVTGGCVSFVWLLLTHILLGRLSWDLDAQAELVDAIFSATSGKALVPLVALFGLVAGICIGRGRKADGNAYGIVSAGAFVASLALVSWFGFGRSGDPHHVAWVYVVYAAAVGMDRHGSHLGGGLARRRVSLCVTVRSRTSLDIRAFDSRDPRGLGCRSVVIFQNKQAIPRTTSMDRIGAGNIDRDNHTTDRRDV